MFLVKPSIFCLFEKLVGKNPKVWKHQMLARMWTNKNLNSLMVAMQNGTGTLADIWKFLTNQISSYHMIQQSYLAKWIENLRPYKNL